MPAIETSERNTVINLKVYGVYSVNSVAMSSPCKFNTRVQYKNLKNLRVGVEPSLCYVLDSE